MKKIILIIMTTALLMTGLIGCSSNPVTSKSQSEASGESSSSKSNPASISASPNPSASSEIPFSTPASSSASSVKTSSAVHSAVESVTIAPQGKTYKPATTSLTGTISFSGSTSVYPVIAALTEAFKKQYPNVKIQITNVTGSGAGLADAKSGSVSFGMRSSAWDSTTAASNPTIKPYQIAIDGVAIVVHPSNTLANITLAEIKLIYQGTDMNGINAPVNREDGSGTKTCFKDIIAASSYRGVIVSSTDAVALAVAGNAGAIGYMSLGSVGSNVKKLNVEGIEPTSTNVVNGTYKMSRPFLLLRRTDRSMNAAEKEFLKFALSSDGQKVISQSNFIPLADTQIANELAKIS